MQMLIRDKTMTKIQTDSATNELMDVIKLAGNSAFAGSNDRFNVGVGNINRSTILSVWRSSGLFKKIVTKYPNEARNAGYEIKQDKDVLYRTDATLYNAFCEGDKQGRLFGTAYVILKDGYDLSEPLDGVLIDYECLLDLYKNGDEYFSDGSRTFHESRVYVFYGERSYIPDLSPYDPAYAYSILESIQIDLRHYFNGYNTTQSILRNLSNVVLGVKGLGMRLKTNKENVLTRLLTFDLNRRNENAIMHDKDDETINYISQSLSNVPEVMSSFRECLCAATNYPITQLFPSTQSNGISSGIQNSVVQRFEWSVLVQKYADATYSDHLRRYYSEIVKGDFQINIPLPMRISLVEQAEFEKIIAERNKILVDTQIVSINEIRQCYNTEETLIDVILLPGTNTNSNSNSNGKKPTNASMEN